MVREDLISFGWERFLQEGDDGSSTSTYDDDHSTYDGDYSTYYDDDYEWTPPMKWDFLHLGTVIICGSTVVPPCCGCFVCFDTVL